MEGEQSPWQRTLKVHAGGGAPLRKRGCEVGLKKEGEKSSVLNSMHERPVRAEGIEKRGNVSPDQGYR